MSFNVYKWSDADAPAYDTSKGSLIELLEKCLVTGYGSGAEETLPPDPAWSVEKSADGLHAVFWSNSTHPEASGHYFYVRDDGEVDGDPALDGVLEHGREAYIQGATAYTGFDASDRPELSGIFPFEADLPRGAVWEKRNATTYSNPASWVLVADARTVYQFIGNWDTDDADAANYASLNDFGRSGRMNGFGDLKPLMQPGLISGVWCGDGYNNTSGDTMYGSLLRFDSAGSDGVCTSAMVTDSAGLNSIERNHGDNSEYLGQRQGAMAGENWDPATQRVIEEPCIVSLTNSTSSTNNGPYLAQLRGIREPFLQFGSTQRTGPFFDSVLGRVSGDPYFMHYTFSGAERFIIVNDPYSFDTSPVFFDLEDDH